MLEAFVAAAAGRLQVAAHCGAQTTADTVALAAHAAEAGRRCGRGDRAAVLPARRARAARALRRGRRRVRAAAVLRLRVRARERVRRSARRSSHELRERAPNLAGLKVSDAPFERFSPYLLEGLDVFVGPEALIFDGISGGAAGAVSGLAAAFPDRVAAVVREPTDAGAVALGELRAAVERFPRHAALKFVLGLARRCRCARTSGGRCGS